jgi:hypothetical protein
MNDSNFHSENKVWRNWDNLSENERLNAEAIWLQVCEEQDCVPVSDWWESLSPEEQEEAIGGLPI